MLQIECALYKVFRDSAGLRDRRMIEDSNQQLYICLRAKSVLCDLVLSTSSRFDGTGQAESMIGL